MPFSFSGNFAWWFNGLTWNLGPIQAPNLSSNSFELKNQKKW